MSEDPFGSTRRRPPPPRLRLSTAERLSLSDNNLGPTPFILPSSARSEPGPSSPSASDRSFSLSHSLPSPNPAIHSQDAGLFVSSSPRPPDYDPPHGPDSMIDRPFPSCEPNHYSSIPPVPPLPAHLAHLNPHLGPLSTPSSLTPQSLVQRLEQLLQAKSHEIQLAGQLGNSLLEQQAELELRIAELDPALAALAPSDPALSRRDRDRTPLARDASPRTSLSAQAILDDSPDTVPITLDDSVRRKLDELQGAMKRWHETNAELWRLARGELPAISRPSSPLSLSPNGFPPVTPLNHQQPSGPMGFSSAYKLPSPHSPVPPAPASANHSNQRARSVQHRANDIEFATEIGQSLLGEVRRLQSLLATRDDEMVEAREEREGLWERNENLMERIKDYEASVEKFKEENWNLELSKQELQHKLSAATIERAKLDSDRLKLTKQLTELQHTSDQQRAELERLTALRSEERGQHESTVATLRKNHSGLQRERNDLQGAVDGLRAELESIKKKAAAKRVVSGMSAGSDDGQLDGRTEEEMLASRTTPGKRKPGDNHHVLGTPSEPFGDAESDDSSPGSPARQRGLGSNLGFSTENDQLRTSLAHAQRTISTLRAALQRKKEDALRSKKSSAASVALGETADMLMHTLDDNDEDDDEEESVPRWHAGPSSTRGTPRTLLRGRARGGLPSRRGRFRGTPSKLSKRADARSSSESDEPMPQHPADLLLSLQAEHDPFGPPGPRPAMEGRESFGDMMDPMFASVGAEIGRGMAQTTQDDDDGEGGGPGSRDDSTRDWRPLQEVLGGSLGDGEDDLSGQNSGRLDSGRTSLQWPDEVKAALGRRRGREHKQSSVGVEVGTMTEPEQVQVERVEVVREVPVDRIVEKLVEVPVDRIVEKIVEVPVDRIAEKIVEVPVDRIVEKIVEVPVDRIVEKIVEAPVDRIVEKIIEWLVEERVPERGVQETDQDGAERGRVDKVSKQAGEERGIVERVIEVVGEREVVEVEKLVEVEKIVEVEKLVEVEKIVEVEKLVEVEKIVEVEKVVEVEKLVEVEKIVEVVKTVEVEKLIEPTKAVGVEKSVQTDKIADQIVEVPVEKIVKVPVDRVVERIVEVPVEKIVEVERIVQVPAVKELVSLTARQSAMTQTELCPPKAMATVGTNTEESLVKTSLVPSHSTMTQTDLGPPKAMANVGTNTEESLAKNSLALRQSAMTQTDLDSPKAMAHVGTNTEASLAKTVSHIGTSADERLGELPLASGSLLSSPPKGPQPKKVSAKQRNRLSTLSHIMSMSEVESEHEQMFSADEEMIDTDQDDFEDARESVASGIRGQKVMKAAALSDDLASHLLAPTEDDMESMVNSARVSQVTMKPQSLDEPTLLAPSPRAPDGAPDMDPKLERSPLSQDVKQLPLESLKLKTSEIGVQTEGSYEPTARVSKYSFDLPDRDSMTTFGRTSTIDLMQSKSSNGTFRKHRARSLSTVSGYRDPGRRMVSPQESEFSVNRISLASSVRSEVTNVSEHTTQGRTSFGRKRNSVARNKTTEYPADREQVVSRSKHTTELPPLPSKPPSNPRSGPIDRRFVTPQSSASGFRPKRPSSPPPKELVQKASITPRTAQLAVPVPPPSPFRRSSYSSMPPPSQTRDGGVSPRQSSAKKPSTMSRAHHPYDKSENFTETDDFGQFGVATMTGGAARYESSRRRAQTMNPSPMGSSTEHLSQRSRGQSFTSDRTSEPGELAQEQAARLGNGVGQMSTDPGAIHAITQTMIGEFLYKYTTKTLKKGFSEKRHRRFFWVHPYTKTLYWSSSDPGAHGNNQSTAKSVFIESVRSIDDHNSMPSGLASHSLVIQTPNREMKITAPTKARHELWLSAIKYLITRPEPTPGGAIGGGSLPPRAMSPARSPRVVPPATFSGRSAMLSRFRTHEPATLSTPPAVRQAIYGHGGLKSATNSPLNRSVASSDRLTPKASKGTSGYPSPMKRASTPAAEFMKQINAAQRYEAETGRAANGARHVLLQPERERGTPNGRTWPADGMEFVDETDVSMSYESRGEESQDEGFEGLENVRACCDGKHDVGSLSRRHGSQNQQHHEHSHSHSTSGHARAPSRGTLASVFRTMDEGEVSSGKTQSGASRTAESPSLRASNLASLRTRYGGASSPGPQMQLQMQIQQAQEAHDYGSSSSSMLGLQGYLGVGHQQYPNHQHHPPPPPLQSSSSSSGRTSPAGTTVSSNKFQRESKFFQDLKSFHPSIERLQTPQKKNEKNVIDQLQNSQLGSSSNSNGGVTHNKRKSQAGSSSFNGRSGGGRFGTSSVCGSDLGD